MHLLSCDSPPARSLFVGALGLVVSCITQSLAAIPRINLELYGRRSFSCADPSLWNALPLGLRTQLDPDCFRRDLKTHPFNVASS